MNCPPYTVGWRILWVSLAVCCRLPGQMLLRQQKLYNVSISMMWDCNKETNYQHQIVNILNRQYECVFTDDSGKIQYKGKSELPDIPQINFSTLRVEIQLRELDNKKVPGPDEIPARKLKEASTEFGPILRNIFQKSYESSDLPDDWKTANILAIYMKVIKRPSQLPSCVANIYLLQSNGANTMLKNFQTPW